MGNVTIRQAGGIRYLTFSNLEDEGILHGVTLRHGGVSAAPYGTLNLGEHVGDDPGAVWENRKRLANALGYNPKHVSTGQQVHGVHIIRVAEEERGRGHRNWEDALPDTDGLITTEPGIVLMAHAADCTLLFFHDPVRKAIGLAHAGWRSAVAGMAPRMVAAMEVLGCVRENIRVALSPCIGPCCYQIGSNVAQAVAEEFRSRVITEKETGLYFDLPQLQILQLLAAGIREDNVVSNGVCTNCTNEHYFSHRASGGRTGRMAGVIAMKPGRRAIT